MNLKQTKQNIILYLVTLTFALIMWFFVFPTQITVPKSALTKVFSPKTLPQFADMVIILCSLFGIASSLIRLMLYKKKNGSIKTERPSLGKGKELFGHFIPFVILGLMLLYYILIRNIGYIWSTVIVPPIILLVLGCRKWTFYLYTYVFSAVMYCLFRFLLSVRLP